MPYHYPDIFTEVHTSGQLTDTDKIGILTNSARNGDL